MFITKQYYSFLEQLNNESNILLDSFEVSMDTLFVFILLLWKQAELD